MGTPLKHKNGLIHMLYHFTHCRCSISNLLAE